MTKKDYVLIATAIADVGNEVMNNKQADANYAFRCFIDHISEALHNDNDRFDYDKFEEYIQKHMSR